MNFKIVRALTSVLLSIIILSACSKSKKSKESEISDEIVLKIGNVEISRYEFEKNMSQALDIKKATAKEKEIWITNFIDNTYLLVDALDKKYDTVGITKRVVDYAAKTMMSRVDGYLWNDRVKPFLEIKKTDIKKAYSKRKELFYLEFLRFPDEDSLPGFMKNTNKPISLNEFNSLAAQYQKTKNNTFVSQAMLWPYDFEIAPFCDMIYTMEEGEISGLLRSFPNFFIIHLVQKEKINQKSLREESEEIKTILEQTKTYVIAIQKQEEVFAKAKVSINKKLLDTALSLLPKFDYDSSKYKNNKMLNEAIITYSFNNKPREYTIAQLIEYSYYNPLNFVIEKMENLKEVLPNIVLEEYLFAEADSLKVTDDVQYVLDRKNFLNKLVISDYEKNEFKNKVNISDKEKIDYYNTYKEKFTDGENAIVTVLHFKDQSSSFNNNYLVQSYVQSGEVFKLCDTLLLRGLTHCETEKKVNFSSTEYPPYIIKILFGMDNNTSYDPFEYNRQYFTFYKIREEGKRILSFKEVEDEVSYIIETDKINALKKDKLDELKKKYPVTLNKISK